jgi:hypothetical protein
MSPAEATERLIKPCVCGIGNPERIQKTLVEMAEQP